MTEFWSDRFHWCALAAGFVAAAEGWIHDSERVKRLAYQWYAEGAFRDEQRAKEQAVHRPGKRGVMWPFKKTPTQDDLVKAHREMVETAAVYQACDKSYYSSDKTSEERVALKIAYLKAGKARTEAERRYDRLERIFRKANGLE